MKFTALLSMFGLINAQQEFLREVTDSKEEFFTKKNRFGNYEVNIDTNIDDLIFSKDIILGAVNEKYWFDYEQQTMHLQDLTKYFKHEKEFRQPKDVEPVCHTHNQVNPDPDA